MPRLGVEVWSGISSFGQAMVGHRRLLIAMALGAGLVYIPQGLTMTVVQLIAAGFSGYLIRDAPRLDNKAHGETRTRVFPGG